jgi:DnaJ-class molecular chaperone
MSCPTCHGTGTYWIDDGNGCVAKEPCDHCEAFNDSLPRQANA